MKYLNKNLIIIGVLAVILVGFYTIDFNSDQASVITLPDFNTEVKAAEDTPINSLKDLNDAIVEIADKTNPSVVTVFTTQTVRRPANPFFRFFDSPFDMPRDREDYREFQRQGLGSGVIASEDGYIITNNHVVDGADEIKVQSYDGTEMDAELVGSDPQTDVAVLKVSADNLPAVSFGNSDELRVGEFVLAIGSPFGQNLAHSVSFGIVSGKGRIIGMAQQTGGYEDFIQTDAAINPGNSGGALINVDGELVGINTAIATRSGGNQGVGFAIPINLAKNIMNQLIEKGRVSRGYLGIYHGGDVDQTMAKALGLDQNYGVIVGRVDDGTPAEKAGLKEGDVILSLNGKKVSDWLSFRTDIASKRPGSTVTLGIVRDGEEMEIDVTLGELPEEATASADTPDQDLEEQLGFRVRTLTDDIARQLELEPGIEGVVVTNISRGSGAYNQGLREGDVITSVSRNPVSNANEFYEAVQEINEEGKQVVLLQIIRGGNQMFVAFEI